MALPSPSDLVWIIGFTPHGRWIAPIMRAAVRAEWEEAVQSASNQLGDASLAHELMESAIEQTKEHLADLAPVTADEARQILRRYYRNALRRERRSRMKLHLVGTNGDLEFLLPPDTSIADSISATSDLASVLSDTPEDLQHALLMRYGARSRWDEVAEELHRPKDTIRMRCARELRRIRSKLGIRSRPD